MYADADADGIADNKDNCITLPNPSQADFDLDLRGDVCDEDDDNDGIIDAVDAFEKNPIEWADFDLI